MNAVEQLRKIWTPNREVEEIAADLSPQTELDSLIRHALHAIAQQAGRPIQVDMDEVNKGMLRIEHVAVRNEQTTTGNMLVIWVED